MIDARITAVIENLSSLIVSHSRLLASEQHSPNADADRSDDLIREHGAWIAELRAIRERFENLVTGVV